MSLPDLPANWLWCLVDGAWGAIHRNGSQPTRHCSGFGPARPSGIVLPSGQFHVTIDQWEAAEEISDIVRIVNTPVTPEVARGDGEQ